VGKAVANRGVTESIASLTRDLRTIDEAAHLNNCKEEKTMKKILGVMALLGASGAMMVTPALANDRVDNAHRGMHTAYVADRDHDRRENDRDRRQPVRREEVRYANRFDAPYCR
jgi:hypothetical protein